MGENRFCLDQTKGDSVKVCTTDTDREVKKKFFCLYFCFNLEDQI